MSLKAPIFAGRRPWFFVTLTLSCFTILAVTFSLWELVEHHYFRDLNYLTLHYMYITRGVTSSILVGIWATWFVLRERRRREEQLEESCAHYRTILDHVPEAVVLCDAGFRVAEWNEAAERLYGVPRQQMVGQVLTTVPLERWSELEEAAARAAEDQRILDKETERRTGDGGRIPVAVSYSSIPPSDSRPRLLVELAQDIRPRLRDRERLLEVEKLALMGQIAAGTAHHLNTPLTAVLLQVELLRQQPAPDGGNMTELAAIEQRVRFCQAFVQNLLRFARRPQMRRKPLALCDAIEAAATLFRPSLALKMASLHIDLHEILPCRILGDPNYLEVAFSVLISNAVDAIPREGRVYIHCSLKADHQAEVYVDDSGPGIANELLPRVFEPFFTTKPAGQGTGLGLSIARNLVQEHGGVLQLQNRERGGLRAIVSLPLLEGPAARESRREEVFG
ncbi:MAG: PAS domain S-box protein [Acidobacteria bacterium]|nr:PAS domain S-box protein [Acidobacteriota bacterium]